MPGPFPGMDPYLENTFRWRGFHGHFISDMAYQLNGQLPEGLIAQYEERCYIMPLEDYIYPDAIVVRPPDSDEAPGIEAIRTANQTITETLPEIVKYTPQEIREPYIEIITADDAERVITVIELLSPTNKLSGPGLEEYQLKQNRILDSSSHLLEIDLLREGSPMVAAAHKGRIATRTKFDYIISLHRAGSNRQRFEIWPFTVRERMPVIRVPITAGMPDIHLDLQSIMDGVYDRSGVRHRLRYKEEPEPTLSPADAAWADALLKSKQLR